MDDTEARAAIGWINWLEAQGARRGDANVPDGSARRRGTGPLPTSTTAADAFGGSSADFRFGTGPLTGQPGYTGPLSQPTAESLRRMFAELANEGAQSRVVEGALVDPADGPSLETHRESAVPQEWSDREALDAGWQPPDALSAEVARHLHSEMADTDRLGGDDRNGEQSANRGEPVTLEALEHQFHESGFQTFDLQSGNIAALAQQAPTLDAAAVAGRSPEVVWESRDALDVPEEPVAVNATTARSATRVPDASDYPSRLAWAREQRASGELSTAFREYRTLLKNAPGLLGDVVADLNESLESTPDHPELHQLLGDARIRQGDYLGALESYNRAVALTQGQNN